MPPQIAPGQYHGLMQHPQHRDENSEDESWLKKVGRTVVDVITNLRCTDQMYTTIDKDNEIDISNDPPHPVRPSYHSFRPQSQPRILGPPPHMKRF